ncbi:hypothetical protein R1flu_015278 [Riccia fluitans]|uniref:Uncharacterized protein n=1 Tax=Riccia fluitans TaxID=41844 RepID=A0ABD1YMA5_9MARC
MPNEFERDILVTLGLTSSDDSGAEFEQNRNRGQFCRTVDSNIARIAAVNVIPAHLFPFDGVSGEWNPETPSLAIRSANARRWAVHQIAAAQEVKQEQAMACGRAVLIVPSLLSCALVHSTLQLQILSSPFFCLALDVTRIEKLSIH